MRSVVVTVLVGAASVVAAADARYPPDLVGSSAIGRTSACGFLANLKAAVAQHDNAKVASMVAFPFSLNGRGKRRGIWNRTAFLRQYNAIFNSNVRHALEEQTCHSLFGNWQGAMIGRGQIWFDLRCQPSDSNCRSQGPFITAVNPDAPPVK